MTYSMTAFARQETADETGSLIWELRSINHRYLDASFRLSESFRALEPKLRDLLRKKVQRGKVEVSLRFQAGQSSQVELAVNQELAKQLAIAHQQLSDQFPNAAPLQLAQLLQWPGLVASSDVNLDEIQEKALSLFDQALDQLLGMREREGAQLSEFLQTRLSKISEFVSKVREHYPKALELQQQKLQDRLAEIKEQLDPSRLEQEMVMMAQKSDIAEELDRLDAHVKEVRRVLKKGGAMGRRLDFLMQEFNREANTLSAKSQDVEMTQSAVEIKVLVEQMREQVQNIE